MPAGNALSDLVFGGLSPSPGAIAQALQLNTTKVVFVRQERLDGLPAAEYRLTVATSALGKDANSLGALGPAHPVLMWVDDQHRLVRLSLTVVSPPPVTMTTAWSQFNLRAPAFHLPPADQVETVSQYQKAVARAACGQGQKGGACRTK
jgi:hypothetical protein